MLSYSVLTPMANSTTMATRVPASEKGLKDAVEKMEPLLTEKCPFVNRHNIKEKVQWVRPKLVCEVEYAELTANDQLRQTTFLGWRDDKKAKEVVLEQSQVA